MKAHKKYFYIFIQQLKYFGRFYKMGMDRNMPLKEQISKNILGLMDQRGWTQLKLSLESGISKSTISDYIRCRTLINPGNVEKMANAFQVAKSEIDPSFKTKEKKNDLPELNSKDERDIQKDLEDIINNLESSSGYAAFDGKDIEEMDPEDKELLIASLENSLRLAKRIAKQKFTPNKYKK
jgi:transcriptional regulator with XRE-family HTH domain